LECLRVRRGCVEIGPDTHIIIGEPNPDPDQLTVEMPWGAGKVMRAVLNLIVDQANEKIASCEWEAPNRRVEAWRREPVACGCDDSARRLGVNRSSVHEALKALEDHGCIERVRRLDLLGRPGAGAWTWRLVVTP